MGRHRDAVADNLDAAQTGLRSNHLAYVIYTSGSTGQAEGCDERASCGDQSAAVDAEHLLPGSADRVLQKTPFSFDVSVWEFFWTLMTGARLIVARPQGHQDPDVSAARSSRQAGITTLHFVPSMLQIFLDHVQPGQCRSLRHVVCSGEELPASLQSTILRAVAACAPGKSVRADGSGRGRHVLGVPARATSSRACLSGGRSANTQIYMLDRHRSAGADRRGG